MFDSSINETANTTPRQVFRHYSRKILIMPSSRYHHERRIEAALSMTEKEPLQGAIADFFYGCWYDMPYYGEQFFSRIQERLHPQTKQAFYDCIHKQNYLGYSSVLATRWSVLVTPSFNVATHHLRTSSDDARGVAKYTVEQLLTARDNEDWTEVERIETEFFGHCLACEDRLAFSIVWFSLGKNNWHLDARWQDCQQCLEQIPNKKSNRKLKKTSRI